MREVEAETNRSKEREESFTKKYVDVEARTILNQNYERIRREEEERRTNRLRV